MKRALVINLNDLGDILLSTPFIRNLHENGFSVDVVTDAGFAKALYKNPRVNKILAFERNKVRQLLLDGETQKAVDMAAGFTSGLSGYDISFNLHSSLLSAMLQEAAVAGTKAGLIRENGKLIYKNAYEFYVSMRGRQEKKNNRIHAVSLFNSMLECAGIKVNDYSPEYFGAEDDTPYNDKDVLLHIGNGGAVKKWPSSYWAELCGLIKADGFYPVITGGASDTSEAAEIAAGADVRTDCGMSLPQIAAALKKCAYLVTTDTGILHLASGLGTKTVAVFGPTSVYETGGFSDGCAMLAPDLRCSPCFRDDCPSKKCMKMTKPEHVMQVLHGNAADAVKVNGIGAVNPVISSQDKIRKALLLLRPGMNAADITGEMKKINPKNSAASSVIFSALMPALKVAPSEMQRTGNTR